MIGTCLLHWVSQVQSQGRGNPNFSRDLYQQDPRGCHSDVMNEQPIVTVSMLDK